MQNFIDIGETILQKSVTTSGSAMAEGPRDSLSVEIL